MEAYLKKVALIGAVPVLLSVIFVVVFAKEVLHIVYGGTYDQFVSVLRVVSVASLFTFLSTLIVVALKAMEQTRTLFIARSVSQVFLLTGGLLLMAKAGLDGAAWVSLLAAIFSFLVMAVGYWRVTRSRAAGQAAVDSAGG
jgi:O-antigen/teichoic acid export membrane protein